MKTFASTPTFDDVNLILRLYEMRRDERLRTARAWFMSSFKARTMDEWLALCPPGSDANASYRMVVSYWEMVASFITSGVLNAELFYQSGRELLFCYARVRFVLPAIRQRYNNPAEFKNLETVAQGFIGWWNHHTPGAYDAFLERIGAA
jgi:hypothetical protein